MLLWYFLIIGFILFWFYGYNRSKVGDECGF